MDQVHDFLTQCDWLTPLCGPRTECARVSAWHLRKPCRTYAFFINNASELPGILAKLLDMISNDDSLRETICWSTACRDCVGGTISVRVRVAYEPPTNKGHLSGFLG